MKGRSLLPYSLPGLFLAVLAGCQSDSGPRNVNVGSDSRGNIVGVPAADIDAYAKEKGISRDEAEARIRQAVAQTSQPSAVRVDPASLPIGAPCRVDLIRPMHKGAAYEGTILRVTKDEIVLGRAVFEGPSNRPTVPILKEIPFVGERYFGDERGITRTNVDQKEVRIPRSEVAALKLLDQRPMPVRREE
jgi:hypothetical protein